MRFQLSCPLLPAFESNDWDAIRRVFEKCPARPLGQAWNEITEPAFLPATARFGWRGTIVWVYALMEDRDIFNAADGPNQSMWLLGDTLELFLRPPGGETYYEFHITPDNHRLQLRFADDKDLASGGDFTRFHVQEPLFQSQTLVEAEHNRWSVLLSLDQRDVAENWASSDESALFSVSRYDWTRGQEKPVISSTSSHQKPWFHRQKEWGELVFVD